MNDRMPKQTKWYFFGKMNTPSPCYSYWFQKPQNREKCSLMINVFVSSEEHYYVMQWYFLSMMREQDSTKMGGLLWRLTKSDEPEETLNFSAFEVSEELFIDIESPSTEELDKSTSLLKRNKGTGVDNITAKNKDGSESVREWPLRKC